RIQSRRVPRRRLSQSDGRALRGHFFRHPRLPPIYFLMPIAFKEWAVTVRALAEGEQLLTLRKGGIREPEKNFKLNYQRFFLYPTFDHQRTDLVRQSHQPELARALEEGVWSDDEPPPDSLYRGMEIPQPDRVRIRAWA